MEKKSIFGKIDAFYTKSVKVIIGDIPLDEEKKTAGAKSKRPAAPKNKIEVIKQTFTTVKSKFLNLGKPSEKELLYKEVVKKEKQEAKTKKKASKKTVTKKTTAKKVTKKTSSTTAKTATKKESPTSKKTVAKKTTATTKTAVKKPTSKTTVKSTDKKKASVSKKTTSTPTKTKTTKKAPVKKTTSTAKPKITISKRDAKIALYAKDITKHYGQVDNDFLTIIVKNLGPSIYKRDSELVSCSDPKELDTVRKNFLMKKLDITASRGVLDAAIQDVCTELKGVRTKYRATFYYSLAKKFKKESALS